MTLVSRWFACGYQTAGDKTLATSLDGLTGWTVIDNPLTGPSGECDDIDTNGTDLYVAVGFDNADVISVVTSPDLVTWTTQSTPLDGCEAGTVCYSDALSLWIIGGCGTSTEVLATSSDGVSWTLQTTPFDGGYVSTVRWADALGLFVAVGHDAAHSYLCMTSPDGVTWTAHAGPLYDTRDLAWNGSVLLAGGNGVGGSDDRVATSPDGVTWTAQVTPFDGYQALGVAWDSAGLQWVVGGRQLAAAETVATSPDAVTWTVHSSPFDSGGDSETIAASGGLIVVGGVNGSLTAISSTGGAVWAADPNPIDHFLDRVRHLPITTTPPPPTPSSQSRSPLGLYVLRIFDKLTGTKIADVAVRTEDVRSGLVVTEATRELNQPGDMQFQWPTLDPAMIRFGADGLEGCKVQLWRAGFCWWWGVVTGTHAQADYVVAKAQGWLWCFDGLKFGPITTNYVANPDFSTGDLSGWGAFGVDSAAFDPTVIIRTAVGGVPGSARLVTAAANQDAYLEQTFSMPSHPDQDVVYTIAGWYRIDPTVTYDGPAYLERGLYVALIDAGNVFVHSAPPGRINNRRVGLGTPARLTTQIAVPAGDVGASGRVRLYCPGVAINWGAISATVQESVGTGVNPGDVTDLLHAVVLYAQGLLSPFTDKIDYGIAFQTAAGGANPLTGYLVERHYQFFDLQGVLDAIYEWPSSGIADVGITWNTSAPTVPCFEVFPGLRGSYKPGLAVEWVNGVTRVRARNLLNYSDDLDVNRTYDEIVVLGQGSAGSDREFGRDRDLTDTPWVLRQNVRSAPPDAPIDTLDPRATKALGVLRAPVRVPVLTVPGVLCTEIEEGDTIPVRIDYGYIQTTATHRIVRMTLDPVRDQLRLEVNVAT